MPITEAPQPGAPKSAVTGNIQQKSNSMTPPGPKPAGAVNTPAVTDLKHRSMTPELKPNPDAKKPDGAGRLQTEVNPVLSTKTGATNEVEKDARPAAASNEAVAARE